MRGITKPTNCAGVLRRSRTTGTRNGWLWESRVSGGFGSWHEGVWSFVDVWDQGEHPNVVFTREGSFWCTRTIGAAASSSSSSGEQQQGVGRRSRRLLLRSRIIRECTPRPGTGHGVLGRGHLRLGNDVACRHRGHPHMDGHAGRYPG